MMRMVVVMMVMKLVEVVGNLKKRRRKMNQTSNYEANSRQRYMCSLGYPKKTLMLNFAMVKKSRHRFCDEDIDRCGSNWSKGTKMCNFGSKIWIFGAKCPFFVLESRKQPKWGIFGGTKIPPIWLFLAPPADLVEFFWFKMAGKGVPHIDTCSMLDSHL